MTVKETGVKKKSGRVIGFDEEGIKGMSERPDKYKAKVGRTDRVRIMTDVVRYFGSNIKGPGDTGFYAISNADPEDCVLALDGDKAATKRCEDACLLWREGYPISQRFVVLLYHIESTIKNRVKAVGAPIPWSFGAGHYETLRNIQKSLPINEKTGKPRNIKSIELLIDCTDNQFQKMNISPAMGEPKSDRKAILEEIADEFEVSGDPTSPCHLIEDLIAPDPVTSLKASIDRLNNRAEEDDADEFVKPKAGGGKKHKPKPEEADAEADELDDVDEDIDDDELDDEPAAKVKPKGKPKPKPVDDDDADDVEEPDDEGDDAEPDDEPAPKPKGKFKAKGAKGTAKKPASDDDDLDFEDDL